MIDIKKIALGTANWGQNYGVFNNKNLAKIEIKKILYHSELAGLDTLDTAHLYGNSEEYLGNFDLNKFKVITKTNFFNESFITNKNADDLQKTLKLSLEKLNQKNIYGLLIHRSTDLLKEGGEKLIRKLKELKEKELVQKIGISIYDPKILSKIYKLFIPDIVQLPINVFNQESILEGYLDEMKEKNIEIHARSIFLQGLLLNSFEKLPNYFYEWKDLFFKWDYFCSSNNISKLEACINFALNIDLIDKLVLGFDDFNQFKECLEIVKMKKEFNFKEFNINDKFLIDPSKWKV